MNEEVTKTVTIFGYNDDVTLIRDATYLVYGELWITVYRTGGSLANFKIFDVTKVTECPNVG